MELLFLRHPRRSTNSSKLFHPNTSGRYPPTLARGTTPVCFHCDQRACHTFNRQPPRSSKSNIHSLNTTLTQTKVSCNTNLPCAFKVPVFCVFCNSHRLT